MGQHCWDEVAWDIHSVKVLFKKSAQMLQDCMQNARCSSAQQHPNAVIGTISIHMEYFTSISYKRALGLVWILVEILMMSAKRSLLQMHFFLNLAFLNASLSS